MSFHEEQELLQELHHEDQRLFITELHRQLQLALIEIRQLAETNKKLAIDNQELEESRAQAINEQARTAQRLQLVSAQLDFMEQQCYDLSKDKEEMDLSQKDSDMLRKERALREELQQREDESRLLVETLQDEVHELQKSERTLQQKYTTIHTKYEDISKRYDHVKRQQQELELARESKEALAWLKETTNRLCSPPESGITQTTQLDRRASQGSGYISNHQTSPPPSPPYLSSLIDPPLAAQNQLISLIKELATTNATLRSDVKEYRDLLQDTRNDMLAMQSQLELYEQGNGCGNCYGARMDEDDDYSRNGWGTLGMQISSGLDAASHIGTLGSAPNSPPSSRQFSHSFFSGVRGNVFGELERHYSLNSSTSKRRGKGHSSKRSKRRTSKEHPLSNSAIEEEPHGTASSPTNKSWNRRSVDRGTLRSGNDSDEQDNSVRQSTGTEEESESDTEDPANVDAADGGVLSQSDNNQSGLPSSKPDDMALEDENTLEPSEHDVASSTVKSPSVPDPEDHFKPRNRSISLLSAELQKATRIEALTGRDMEGGLDHVKQGVHPLDLELGSSQLLSSDVAMEDKMSVASWGKDKAARMRPPMHEKSMSDQGPSERAQRRLSEPVHQHSSSPGSFTKKNRPSSIYSIRRPRPRFEPPGVVAGAHGSHGAGSNSGIQDSPIYKSAELLGQIMTEQRQQMMEAWRAGVATAAVPQQQSGHTTVSFGEQRKDADNMSIRSKASRRRVRSAAKQVDATGGDEKAFGVDQSTPSTDLTSAVKAISGLENQAQTIEAGNGSAPTAGDLQGQSPESGKSESRKEKEKKRRSVRSTRSVRASILPPGARDRRFPSETSTASEAFSDRRHNLEQSPYQLLHTLSTDLHERLARSDPRELNRRLKRTFDIQALSQMSNSVIENVLTDIGTLSERFRWLEAHPVTDLTSVILDYPPKSGALSVGSEDDDGDDESGESDFSVEEEQEKWSFRATEFFPFTHSVQELLSENGKLRMTINDLQLSIVQKVEQDRIKAEKDFLQEHPEEDFSDDQTIDGRSGYPAASRPAQNSSTKDRPRILGSASTGVSGIFSKLFRANSQSNTNARAQTVQRPPVAPSEGSADRRGVSKSKSGPAVADLSRILAESSKATAPRTSSQSVMIDGTRASGSSAILVPGSRMSASTSLAAMAATSPARSSTIHIVESPGTPPTMSASVAALARTKAMSSQNLLSRSVPHTRYYDNPPSEDEAIIISRGAPGHGLTGASYKSYTSTSEDDKLSSRLETVDEYPDDHEGGLDASKSTKQDRHSLLVNKSLRSIDVSTRSSNLAMSVVTKQDVFHDHWTASTPSSFSANMSSRATSERRATGDSTAGLGTIFEQHRGVVSTTSLSSNSVTSETTSNVTSRLVSKPTIVTQSALTVAKPATSTVSSPMDTNWNDIKRFPGEPGHDMVHDDYVQEPSVNEPIQPRAGSGLGVGEQEGAASRAGGRESAVAFLRSEMQASSILGSFLQTQSQSHSQSHSRNHSQSHSPARPQSPAGIPSVRRSTSKPNLKGKGLSSENASSSTNSAKDSFEIMRDGAEYEESSSSQAEYYYREGDLANMPGSSKPSLSAISALQKVAPSLGNISAPTASLAVTSTAVAYVVATPDAGGPEEESSRRRKQVFDRDLIRASQKRILAGVPSQDRVFVPQPRPRRARALSVDSAQSVEPKPNEILDLWRVGADASRDFWRGLIKKVDGRDSGGRDSGGRDS
ncbi:hypothetical protein BGX31_010718 [Mortierella sp. GBA43]|nr:hypothetical protein BGX31_010718 [Mortierella sp. GBA43]